MANEGVHRVHLMLSSPGGSVDAAITAYNVLRGMPFHLVTHNVGRVESMGNVLFLAGADRYACANATFMFHGVGFHVASQTRFEMRSLQSKMDSVEDDQRKIAAVLTDRTRLSEAEIADSFTSVSRRDASWALDRGVIDQVREVEIPAGARVRRVVFK